MKSSLFLTQITAAFGVFFRRYHILLFFVLSVGGLIGATLSLSEIAGTSVALPEQGTYVPFDKTTIERLDSLKTLEEQQQVPFVTPRGQRNPFVE